MKWLILGLVALGSAGVLWWTRRKRLALLVTISEEFDTPEEVEAALRNGGTSEKIIGLWMPMIRRKMEGEPCGAES